MSLGLQNSKQGFCQLFKAARNATPATPPSRRNATKPWQKTCQLFEWDIANSSKFHEPERATGHYMRSNSKTIQNASCGAKKNLSNYHSQAAPMRMYLFVSNIKTFIHETFTVMAVQIDDRPTACKVLAAQKQRACTPCRKARIWFSLCLTESQA